MPEAEYLQYGGQAIIEGVMMRSPRYFSVACRAPNKEIVLRTEPIEKTWVGRQKWLKRPFLRGTLALLDAMALGIKAMKFASSVQLDPALQPEGVAIEIPEIPSRRTRILHALSSLAAFAIYLVGFLFADAIARWLGAFLVFLRSDGAGRLVALVFAVLAVFSLFALFARARVIGLSDEDWLSRHRPEPGGMPSGRVQDFAVGATIVVSIGLGLVIFQYLPNLISQNLQRVHWSGTAINFATEIVKIAFFIGYIWLIGRLPEIQEVFKYHGAEHKAINTLEAGQELTLENCRAQTRLHPRCGTSFAIVVLLVGLLLFTWVPRYPLGQQSSLVVNASVRFGVELLALPLIAGLAYELIRFAGKFKNQAFVRALFWPGLMSQYLTTREPEDEQIAVALSALQAVVAAEEEHEATKPDEREQLAAASAADVA